MDTIKAKYGKTQTKRLIVMALSLTAILVFGATMYIYEDVLPSWLLLIVFIFCPVVLFVVFEIHEIGRDDRLTKFEKQYDELRSLINESSYISRTDRNGTIIYVNEQFAERSGYSQSELIGQTHSIVRHPDTPKQFYHTMWRTLIEGKIWRGVVKNRNRLGVTFYVDSTITPIFDSEGEIIEFMSLRYDVTALQNALTSAKEARDAKDRFLATMSHEIRTPLNAILGFVELLRERIKEAELASYLETINRSGHTLLGIINDILDFAKIESGKLEVESRACDLRKDISTTVALFNVAADKKNVLLSEVWSDNFPDCLITDTTRIRQILGNLLSNAIKFTPSGKRVMLCCAFKEETKELEFTVEDEGIGIPESWQRRVFEAFSQVRASDATQQGGTGLGLSISLQLAKILGGTLSVVSEEGKGATFILTVPVLLCQGESPSSAAKKTPASFDGELRHVLVAEDQADNQLLIRLLLEKMNFVVQIVENGKDAVDYYSRESFDIILLDENMPIMSGTKAMLEIRSQEQRWRKKHTPIASLTANAIKGDRERFLKLGFDDYLSKPIIKSELIALLTRLLPN
ncbi:hypothetical protein AGMMS50229_17000 [Campylobacterota bacterium]|nr:hypothetical protein AGMMS50229_17000 [Campylobacterota bacterium]